ncbi:uncharacterized protein LOC144762590 [Lissotriton helveticus]
MGSGSSAARRNRGRSSGAAPRSRGPSPGSSSCSDPCRVPAEEPPPSRTVGPRDCPGPRLASGRPPGTGEDDSDGDLDKALAEFEDLCEPQGGQPQTDPGRRSSPEPPVGTCDPVPGSSPTLIPSLELEGTAAGTAPGWALPDRPPRGVEVPSWGRGHCSTSLLPEQRGSHPGTDLFTRSTKDEQNNNLSNKCHSRKKMTSGSQGPISFDLSEEELMASIEREY